MGLQEIREYIPKHYSFLGKSWDVNLSICCKKIPLRVEYYFPLYERVTFLFSTGDLLTSILKALSKFFSISLRSIPSEESQSIFFASLLSTYKIVLFTAIATLCQTWVESLLHCLTVEGSKTYLNSCFFFLL